MANIDFPTSPVLNQIYSFNNLSWIWLGSYWKSYSASFTATTASCPVGTTTILSAATSANTFSSIFIKYSLNDGTNLRAGNFVMVSNSINSGSSVEYIDTSTNDIGNTSLITIVGTNNGSGINGVNVINGSASSTNIYFEYTLI